MIKQYSSTIWNTGKLHEELKTAFPNYVSVSKNSDFPGTLFIELTQDFTAQEETDFQNLLSNFNNLTTAEYLRDYLNNEVFPATQEILDTFMAENIAMGITQAGKTLPLLALFEDKVNVDGNLVSLKACFDTGSLYAALAVLDYFIANISNYSSLSPFVTAPRLQEMRNKIAAFLGV